MLVDEASLNRKVAALAPTIARLSEAVEEDHVEMRKAINRLIASNEVTRELSENIARITVQTSQRVTDLESKQ